MFSRNLSRLLCGSLFATASLLTLTEAKTCLMVYQLADNNLESYLRQDFEELARSQVISSDDLKTWVYFDAENSGGAPPEALYDEVGNLVTADFTGSRYITYDKVLGAMRVNTTLAGEMDSDSPEVMQVFLQHGMADCVATGYTSFMVVFSSHGGGFAGFGGDENVRLRGRSLAMQFNQKIVEAIQGALGSTPGAPAKLDVLGFDACNMQALGAADEYMEVANYILASEAVEPGHGWAYAALTKADNAYNLALEAGALFANETQGSSHRSPKALSLLDTDLFRVFVTAFEDLFAHLLEAIQADDQTLHAFIGRARASAISFEAVIDATGTENPSGMDIGSFLSNLETLCEPGGDVGAAMTSVRNAYSAMIVQNFIGPGTAPGTGMHVTWPGQGEYVADQDLWDALLFKREIFVTAIVPNFRAFLEFFLGSSIPSLDTDLEATGRVGDTSVCFLGARPDGAAGDEEEGLLYGTDIEVLPDQVKVSAQIGLSVSSVLYEYGLDLTSPLKKMLRAKGYEPEEGDSLYLSGGDVVGTYQMSEFRATWNRNFYFLNISGAAAYEALYVLDQGEGSKNVPVLYFPEEQREQVGNLQFLDYLFFDFSYWTSLGAKYGFLKFSVDDVTGSVNDNLILFTSLKDGRGFKEEPRTSGGMMIPLVYVNGNIQGQKITQLPGGFNQTIINWREDVNYNVISVRDQKIFGVIPDTDAIMVTLKAYDSYNGGVDPETETFDVVRVKGGGTLGEEGGDGEVFGDDMVFGGQESAAMKLNWAGVLAAASYLIFSLM